MNEWPFFLWNERRRWLKPKAYFLLNSWLHHGEAEESSFSAPAFCNSLESCLVLFFIDFLLASSEWLETHINKRIDLLIYVKNQLPLMERPAASTHPNVHFHLCSHFVGAYAFIFSPKLNRPSHIYLLQMVTIRERWAEEENYNLSGGWKWRLWWWRGKKGEGGYGRDDTEVRGGDRKKSEEMRW